MRTGVFGGAFDPVHLGHLLVADDVRRRLRLRRVLLVPTFRPPHRGKTAAPYRHRRRMLELAVSGWRELEVCPVEEERPEPSYTVDTLRVLRVRLPDESLHLIVGADQYREMNRWHAPAELVRLARIVVMDRPGVARPRAFRRHPARRIRFVPVLPVDLSAALVRTRLAKRASVEYMLPTVVSDYIATHRLYR